MKDVSQGKRFTKAMQRPRKGNGWAHADDDSALAAAAEAVAMLNCLNASALYDAARQQGLTSLQLTRMDHNAIMDLCFP